MPAAATVDATAPAPKLGGRKKLIVLIAAAVLLLALIAGAVAMVLKKKKVAGAEGDEVESQAPIAAETVKVDLKSVSPPVFLPLEAFTVNLADREVERYAQLGVTFELDDTKTGDHVKAYMPAIRNNILMLLSAKTAGELLSQEGKLQLAREIRREALRPLGIVVQEPVTHAGGADAAKKKFAPAPVDYPIRAVHFSNLIVQ